MPNTDKGQTFEQYLKAVAKLLREKYRSELLHELATGILLEGPF